MYIRDAVIAFVLLTRWVCRTLISLFQPPLATQPLKPGKRRVEEAREGGIAHMVHAGFSSSRLRIVS